MSNKSKIQGEGDYEAARRHRRSLGEYLKNNDVEKAAERAAPRSAEEARELEAAEAAGKRRAKSASEPATRGKKRGEH